MPEPEEASLTLAESARRAGMTIEGIRDAIRRGKLRAEVVATRPVYAIRPADLEADFLAKLTRSRAAGPVPGSAAKEKGT